MTKLLNKVFSHLVMSYSLWPHGLQHARLPCPSSTPGSCSNSYWVSDAIQPSHHLSSPSIFSLPELGSFPVSQFFTSGGQSIRVLASTSVLPMNTQDWSPCSPGDSSRVFSNTTVQKHQWSNLAYLSSYSTICSWSLSFSTIWNLPLSHLLPMLFSLHFYLFVHS